MKSGINIYKEDVLYHSRFSRERESIGDTHIHTHTQKIYFKELADTIIGIGKSAIHRVGQKAGNLDKISVLQCEDGIPSSPGNKLLLLRPSAD